MTRTRFSFCLIALAAVVMCSDFTMAQGRRDRFGGFGGGGDPNDLLNQEDIQEAIELSEDQIEQIEEINGDWRAGMRDRMPSDMRERFQEDREGAMEMIGEIMKEAREERAAEIDEVLLPHQKKRLTEIGLQSLQVRGNSSLLNSDLFKEKFDITDEEAEELEEALPETEAKFQEKVAKLRADVRKEWFTKVLGRERAKKIEEEFGEPFSFKDQQRGQRGGGQRGGGQRGGGQRGGGQRGGGQRGGRGGDRSDF